MQYINTIFTNKYIMPSDDMIQQFALKFIPSNNDNTIPFEFSSEVKLTYQQVYKLSKILMEKTIKEKWIYLKCRLDSALPWNQ